MKVAALALPDDPCPCCQQRGHLTVDHLRPRAMGGTSKPSNVHALCYHCNHTKGELEGPVSMHYKRAVHQGKLTKAESIVRQFLREWPGYCARHGHGTGVPCLCSACRNAAVQL